MLCMEEKRWCSELISIFEPIKAIPIDLKVMEHVHIEPKHK